MIFDGKSGWVPEVREKIQSPTHKYTVNTPFTLRRVFRKLAEKHKFLYRISMTSFFEINMYKTLIVEDNTTFRQTLRGLLKSRFPSMAFEEAKDGNEALQKTGDFLPDLVFMDIKLPGENGLEITKKIRCSNSEAIIIILTSYDLPEYREAAKQSGANHFVSKGSSTADEILTLVDSVLSDLVSTA